MNLQSYADLGWSVFPVKGLAYAKNYDDTKVSLVKWQSYQRRKPTPEEISDWLRKFPKASVAAATGPINGIFVVDIDSNEWAKRFPHADFGTTWKTRSRNGCHYFYKWQDWMATIKTTGTDIGDIDGFDIRGLGGYVVLPNDNDPDRKWDYSFTEGPAEEMPEFLRQFFQKTLSNPPKKTFVLANVTENKRHTPYTSIIGKMIHAKMNPAEIIEVVTPLVEKTGLGEDPVKLVMDLVSRYPVQQEPERREKLRHESMESLLAEDEPPLEWMIEGLWTDKSRGFVAGLPSAGKTWVALDMMLAVATGGLCLGKYKAAYQAPCLLIEEETSRRNLQGRIHKLGRGRGLAPNALKNVFHITRQLCQMPRDKDALLEIIRKEGIKFVVFDSLREVHTAKENSSDEMAVVLKSFAELGVLGDCSVLLIHHLNKGGDNAGKTIFERMRGTGLFGAWRDCVLGIEAEEGEPIAKCSFQFRDAESPAPIQIKRFVGELTGTIGFEVLDIIDSPKFMVKIEKAKTYLTAHFGTATLTEVAEAIGGRLENSIKDVKTMLKKGILAHKTDGYIGLPE